jgi:small-conductance mechanosensitive channel
MTYLFGIGAFVFSLIAFILWLMFAYATKEAIANNEAKWRNVPWVSISANIAVTVMAAVCWYMVTH